MLRNKMKKIIYITNIISFILFVLFILISILLFDYNISITGIKYKLVGDRVDNSIDVIYFIVLYLWILSICISSYLKYLRNKK